MQLVDIIAIIIMIGVLALAIFVILPWRIKRATYSLIRRMRFQKATNIAGAQTAEQLGVKAHSMWSLRPKDFNPEAISMLMRAGIVELTEDGKYYLNESRMLGTKLEKLLQEDPEKQRPRLPF